MARIRNQNRVSKSSLPLWKVALYIRLSKEDGNDESYSVKNQRQRLNEFYRELTRAEEMQLTGIYADDGCTGTDSDRAQFQQMLSDIDKGMVNCVIVKDLSRLSRNDWECKKYLQHLFVMKDVRFISLELPRLDSYRNPDEIYDMGVSIQSLYNENHCRETSVKVRGTLEMKRKRGEFVGAFAPYGYQKNPEDKHCLLIDEEAACVVRDIFQWFLRDGMSKNAIARKLIVMGIPSPALYKRQKGMKYHNPCLDSKQPRWSARSITAILTNQMYLGHMVQGKQRVRSYKIHTRINTPESEWVIVENTHAPIVDQDTFGQVQKLLLKDTRTPPRSERLYLFSGLLRCADCKRAMGRRTAKNLVYYACRTNTETGLCSRHSIREDKLKRMILEVIRSQIALVEDREGLLHEISGKKAEEDAVSLTEVSMQRRNKELEHLRQIQTGLYLDWKKGEITRQEYQHMKKEFHIKEIEISGIIKKLEAMRQTEEAEQEERSPVTEAFLHHKNILSLDRSIVVELIHAIHIHEGGGLTIEFQFQKPLLNPGSDP